MSTIENPHDDEPSNEDTRDARHEETLAAQRYSLWHSTVYVMFWPLGSEKRVAYIHNHTHHAPGEHDHARIDKATERALGEVAHDVENVDVVDTPACPVAARNAREEVDDGDGRAVATDGGSTMQPENTNSISSNDRRGDHIRDDTSVYGKDEETCPLCGASVYRLPDHLPKCDGAGGKRA